MARLLAVPVNETGCTRSHGVTPNTDKLRINSEAGGNRTAGVNRKTRVSGGQQVDLDLQAGGGTAAMKDRGSGEPE